MTKLFIALTNRKNKTLRKGFILPFTTLIVVLVLFISTGALTLLTKQQYFSRVYRQTQTAYYAADDAIACALSLDDTYVSSDGLGIFPSSSTTPTTPEEYIDDVISEISTKKGLVTPLTRADILCGQSPIFGPGGTPVFDPEFEISDYHFAYQFTNPLTGLQDKEYGVTSTYNMKMDLGIDPADLAGIKHIYRCAKVTVKKTPSFRQIIAQGYSSCDGTANAIERAVVNTTIIE
jgi:hypothetical protein